MSNSNALMSILLTYPPTSELDVLMLGCMFPKYTSVTAKSSLKYTPFLGWFMTLSHTVFINRADRASSRAAFDTAAQTMRDTRQSVFIFPEGTRSYSLAPTLLPLKKGAFHLAVQAQVPLVPVVCANYAHVLDVKGRKFSPGVVEVSVLPPVLTVGMGSEDVNGLVEKVGKDMLEELGRLDGLRREGAEGGQAGGGEGRGSGSGEARGELRRRA
jgi:lysophosphatidate acyltransferase